MRSITFALALIPATPVLAYAQEPMQPLPPADAPAEGGLTRADAFARRGTIEAGGSIGGIITEDTSTFTASPVLGYFVADRIQVSGIFQIAYTRVEDAMGLDDSQTVGSLLVEPSYHYPLGADVLANGGVGLGGGYNGDDINFQVVPALGLDVMTSAHTVITPSIRMPIVIANDETDLDGGGGVDTNVGLALDVGVSATW